MVNEIVECVPQGQMCQCPPAGENTTATTSHAGSHCPMQWSLQKPTLQSVVERGGGGGGSGIFFKKGGRGESNHLLGQFVSELKKRGGAEPKITHDLQ